MRKMTGRSVPQGGFQATGDPAMAHTHFRDFDGRLLKTVPPVAATP